MKPKILIASSSFYKMSLVSQKTLKKLEQKCVVVKNPHKRRLKTKELIKYGKDCIGIIAGLEPFGKEILQNLSNLKVISRDGVGIDNIDLKTAKKLGIKITNTPQATTQAVSELTICLMIALLRHLPQINQDMHQNKWNQLHGYLLQNKTVGIIGMGRIGKRVCELLKPFGCNIIGNDIKPDLAWFRRHKISHVHKRTLYKQSNIVTLHVSYSPQNFHLISYKQFSQMKKGVNFLNLSRGSIVNEKALIKYLTNKHISAAALDVFEKEPYIGSLAKLKNIILTSHIGASTLESRKQMQTDAVNNLLEELKKR